MLNIINSADKNINKLFHKQPDGSFLLSVFDLCLTIIKTEGKKSVKDDSFKYMMLITVFIMIMIPYIEIFRFIN